MKEQDPILADELSRRIAAEMQGKRRPPVSEAIEQEAELAAKLITLAQDTHPDPDFVAALGSQLARRAARKQKSQRNQAPPERPSFWQQLKQMLKEGTTMNRNKYLLGAIGALLLIVVAAYIVMNRNNSSGSEPAITVAEDSNVPTDTTADAENSNAATDTTADAGNDNTANPTSEADEVAEVADLPPLPILDSGNQATGLGGGGGAATSARPQSGGGGDLAEGQAIAADGSFIYTDPFSGTTFTLNTTLPTEPLLSSVLQNKPVDAVTVEQARDLATRFGFTGQLYREQYPVFDAEFIEPVNERPAVYQSFDGPRSLIIDTWGIYYNDTSIINDFENPLPFEQAAPIAEAFLQEHGLIDFEYEMRQIWGTDVNFVRKIDGQPLDQPEITVGVSNDGRIFFISYQVLRNAEILGRYPLISAQAAWERLQSGVVENNIPYNYSVSPELAIAEPAIAIEEDPYADLYQFWAHEYAPGDEIHLYDWPTVYLPVDSGASPRIQVRNYVVQADLATLNALAERVGQQTYIWGVIGSDGTTIELAGWEPIDQIENPISGPGVISRTGDQVLFTNSDTGNVYIVPDAPADLADGLGVYLFAWAARDLGQAYPVVDWENIDKIVNIEPEAPPVEDLPIEEPLPIDGDGRGFEPFTYESFTVNEVTLAYYTTYSWPIDDAGEIRYEGQPTIVVQPTWKFSGQTDTNEYVDFFVQAAEAEHVER